MLDKDKRSVVGAVSNYDLEYLRHCYIFWLDLIYLFVVHIL